MNYAKRPSYVTLDKALPILTGLAALAAVPKADAQANFNTTLTSNTGTSFQYLISNQSPEETQYELVQFAMPISGFTGSYSLSMPNWSILSQTPYDSNGDSVNDGQIVTFGTTNPLSRLAGQDSMSLNFTSTAPTFSSQQINYATQGAGSYSQFANLPSAAAIPEPSTYAALLGGAALIAIAAKKNKEKLTGLARKLFQ